MKLLLPDSASDLLIKDGKLLMRSISVYEILRRFSHIIRLTPFKFEDFSAALIAEDQSALLAEVHIQLLKTLMREDRQQQTWLGPPDLRDSVNVYLQLMDHLNWPSSLRIYLSADPFGNQQFIKTLNQYPSYPLDVEIDTRLEVLEELCEQFLLSNLAREEVVNGGNGSIKHDTTCRSCSKPNGPVVKCYECPAIYHLKCADPPASDGAKALYQCSVCLSNQIEGISDCLSYNERIGNYKRHDSICEDDEGRRYWLLIRRLFVIDDSEEDVRYYTSLKQFNEFTNGLKGYDKALSDCIESQRTEIERQMKITEDLYNKHLPDSKNADGSYSQFLGQDGTHKNYVNIYSANNLALSKTHNSERDAFRSLGNKFCMTANPFKWHGAMNGYSFTLTTTVRNTILRFETMLPQMFTHPCWPNRKSEWIKKVNYAQEPRDYARALSFLECAVKPILFKVAWYDSPGFTHLFRSTFLEREELKKTDRQPRGFERREWLSQDFELSFKLGCAVKFSSKLKPVKHQVWKQKGEEYRLTGLNGWYWRSSTHRSRLKSKPKIFKTEPYKWLSPMNNHPFVVDQIQAEIGSQDVIDVASNLSLADDKRLLYPKHPLVSNYKRKRINKLEGILKIRLNQIEQARLSYKEIQPQQVIKNNGDSISKSDTSTLSNGLTSDLNDSLASLKDVTMKTNDDKNDSIISNGIHKDHENEKSINYSKFLTSLYKNCPPQKMTKKYIPQAKMPPCHDFLTKRHKLRSILVLPDIELRRLARSGGQREARSFSYTAKQNNYVWPYGITPRPAFRTCWLYRNRLINTMQDVALQLRVLHVALRWDDLQVRPPASGQNVITTDDSTITIELLKKRDRLPYMIHTEYLIKKTTTPIEQPTKYRKVGTKKATPSGFRTGLRARRQTEEEEERSPTTEELWVGGDQLEIWELKQFEERIERQIKERQAREENEKRRKMMEEEQKKKAEAERKRRQLEEEKAKALNKTNLGQPATPVIRPASNVPVLRYFRTDKGQIIRLPASYLQRGTPLILRHVGPGPNQTNTYIIRPQISSTNITLTPATQLQQAAPGTPISATIMNIVTPITPTIISTTPTILATTPIRAHAEGQATTKPVEGTPTIKQEQDKTQTDQSLEVSQNTSLISESTVVKQEPEADSTLNQEVIPSREVQANDQDPVEQPLTTEVPASDIAIEQTEPIKQEPEPIKQEPDAIKQEPDATPTNPTTNETAGDKNTPTEPAAPIIKEETL